MMNLDMINDNWLTILESIEFRLEDLAIPKFDSYLNINEKIAISKKHAKDNRLNREIILQDLQEVLEKISLEYINGEEKLRFQIRVCLKSFKNISHSMEGLTENIANELKEKKDKDKFRLGLVIASIQDQTIDSRDWFLSVKALISAAEDVGIDPKPVLKEIAEISNAKNEAGTLWTTRDVFLRIANNQLSE